MRDLAAPFLFRTQSAKTLVTVAVALWMGIACVAQQTPDATGLQASLRQAKALLEQHRWSDAVELLHHITADDPRNADAWIYLGDAQVAQHLNEDAMSSYETALQLHPDAQAAQTAEVHAAVAVALTRRTAGDRDGALAVLLRARRYAPNSPELLTDFGILADSMRIFRDADEALTKAHALAPTDTKTLYALAHTELDEQKMAEAEAHLREYLKMMPQDASAHYGLGHLLHMLSRDDEALGELQESIRLQPRQSESYYEIGEIARERNDAATASREYLHVLSVNPAHGGALTGMGILAYREKNYSQAADYLRRAVQYAPDYVTAHRYYAMTLEHLGDKAESERESALAKSLTEQQNKLSHGYALIDKP